MQRNVSEKHSDYVPRVVGRRERAHRHALLANPPLFHPLLKPLQVSISGVAKSLTWFRDPAFPLLALSPTSTGEAPTSLHRLQTPLTAAIMASAEQLDTEMDDIRTQITNLKAHRANLSSILLSNPSLSTRLQQRSATNDRLRVNASKVVKKQSNRNLESIYRACAGVTAYKVKDPDPNAVDNGNILGVRIEVFVEGKFVETYHVLLNRPSSKRKSVLKIHRHTIPPCIPLKPLADKYLPQAARDSSTTTSQNLIKLGQALRKELVSWHLRTAAVAKLRVAAGIADKPSRSEQIQEDRPVGQILNAFVSDNEEESDEDEPARRRDGPLKITDIECNLAARLIDITWSNGQTGVMKVAKDGQVEQGVIRTAEGARNHDLERKAIGRMEELLQRLSS